MYKIDYNLSVEKRVVIGNTFRTNNLIKSSRVSEFQLCLRTHFIFLICLSGKPCFISKYPFVTDNYM